MDTSYSMVARLDVQLKSIEGALRGGQQTGYDATAVDILAGSEMLEIQARRASE